MIITLVVAASSNNAIGKDNKLLWRMPNDMKYFKNVTWGMPVVMGRKTFEALGGPLSGRKSIILTRKENWNPSNVITVPAFEDAKATVQAMDVKEMMVIGGGEIYRSVMPIADRIHLTRIDAVFTDADTFFPEIDTSAWQLIREQRWSADSRHAYNYSFQVWERKKIAL